MINFAYNNNILKQRKSAKTLAWFSSAPQAVATGHSLTLYFYFISSI